MAVKKLCGHVAFELTRDCNHIPQCPHCLRGCAENLDIDKDLIRSVLDQFSHITTLTLTGGEPSLVPELIEYTIQYIIENQIELGSFYVVTNGRTYSKRMVRALRKAYKYSFEKELCGLSVSVDRYHADNTENLHRYEEEEFYTPDKINPDIDKYLINEGLAYENGIGKRNLSPKQEIDHKYIDFYTANGEDVLVLNDDLIYISANGNVLLDCDLSYYNQDMYAIGNLRYSNLIDIIEAHIA